MVRKAAALSLAATIAVLVPGFGHASRVILRSELESTTIYVNNQRLGTGRELEMKSKRGDTLRVRAEAPGASTVEFQDIVRFNPHYVRIHFPPAPPAPPTGLPRYLVYPLQEVSRRAAHSFELHLVTDTRDSGLVLIDTVRVGGERISTILGNTIEDYALDALMDHFRARGWLKFRVQPRKGDYPTTLLQQEAAAARNSAKWILQISVTREGTAAVRITYELIDHRRKGQLVARTSEMLEDVPDQILEPRE
jgi:hypothetical protein